MWLLINVDNVTDVGKNENERYRLTDNLSIIPSENFGVTVMAMGTVVHPATKKVIIGDSLVTESDLFDEIWGDDDDTL